MIRRTRAGVSAVVAFLLLIPASALAQRGVGEITGVVRDATGGVLPGVTVEVTSPVLIEKVRSTVTDDSGSYRIVELRPGAFPSPVSAAWCVKVSRSRVTSRPPSTQNYAWAP
jgi:hypothetical protein